MIFVRSQKFETCLLTKVEICVYDLKLLACSRGWVGRLFGCLGYARMKGMVRSEIVINWIQFTSRYIHKNLA